MSSETKEWLKEVRASPEYWAEVAVDDFTREIVQRMKRLGVSRADLARRLGTSQAYITKLLGGNTNFTLLTMARVALALEGVVHVRVTDRTTVSVNAERSVPSQGARSRLRRKEERQKSSAKDRRPPAQRASKRLTN